jgi:hypothetical protein
MKERKLLLAASVLLVAAGLMLARPAVGFADNHKALGFFSARG